jgi:hypothetical protein
MNQNSASIYPALQHYLCVFHTVLFRWLAGLLLTTGLFLTKFSRLFPFRFTNSIYFLLILTRKVDDNKQPTVMLISMAGQERVTLCVPHFQCSVIATQS